MVHERGGCPPTPGPFPPISGERGVFLGSIQPVPEGRSRQRALPFEPPFLSNTPLCRTLVTSSLDAPQILRLTHQPPRLGRTRGDLCPLVESHADSSEQDPPFPRNRGKGAGGLGGKRPGFAIRPVNGYKSL